MSEHYSGEPIRDSDGEPYEEPGYGSDKVDYYDGTHVEEPDAEAYEESMKDWTAGEPGIESPQEDMTELDRDQWLRDHIGDYVAPRDGQDVPPEETYSVPSTNVDEEDGDD